MLARRLPSILPDLTFEEALEITKIHSISGLLSENTPFIFNIHNIKIIIPKTLPAPWVIELKSSCLNL